jgi:hypothetical protein
MWTEIQEKLVEILQTIDGVGTVLDFQPIVKTTADLRQIVPIDINNDFNLWIVTRTGFRINRDGVSLSTQEWVHTFKITGWVSTSDGNKSQDDFQDLVEDVLDVISTNISLGLSSYSTMALSPTVDTIGMEFKGDALCNYCDITLPVRELRTVNYV